MHLSLSEARGRFVGQAGHVSGCVLSRPSDAWSPREGSLLRSFYPDHSSAILFVHTCSYCVFVQHSCPVHKWLACGLPTSIAVPERPLPADWPVRSQSSSLSRERFWPPSARVPSLIGRGPPCSPHRTTHFQSYSNLRSRILFSLCDLPNHLPGPMRIHWLR